MHNTEESLRCSEQRTRNTKPPFIKDTHSQCTNHELSYGSTSKIITEQGTKIIPMWPFFRGIFLHDVVCRYYPEFLRSSYLCKYQLELVSSGRLCLLDFLLGGDSLVLFMEVVVILVIIANCMNRQCIDAHMRKALIVSQVCYTEVFLNAWVCQCIGFQMCIHMTILVRCTLYACISVKARCLQLCMYTSPDVLLLASTDYVHCSLSHNNFKFTYYYVCKTVLFINSWRVFTA